MLAQSEKVYIGPGHDHECHATGVTILQVEARIGAQEQPDYSALGAASPSLSAAVKVFGECFDANTNSE
jgi:hypothetical protein